MAYQRFPKALYHPNRTDYNDHITVGDETELKEKMKLGYGESPDNMGQKAEEPGKPVKPKKTDFKGNADGYKQALQKYEEDMVAWEEAQEEE